MFVLRIMSLFFFFKQKTAYEMRISGWSSDVCLIGHVARDRRPVDHDKIGAGILAGFEYGGQAHRLNRRHGGRVELAHVFPERGRRLRVQVDDRSDLAGLLGRDRQTGGERRFPDAPFLRSEEHTSALPSLMRISYAVFCLKNKTHT